MSHNFSASSWVSMLTKLAPNCCWQTASDSWRDVKFILSCDCQFSLIQCDYLPWQSPRLQSAALQLRQSQPAWLAAVPDGGVLQSSVAQTQPLPGPGQLWEQKGSIVAAPRKIFQLNSYIKLQAENIGAAEDSFDRSCVVSVQAKLTLQTRFFPISESEGGGTGLRLNNSAVLSLCLPDWRLFALFIIKEKSRLKD